MQKLIKSWWLLALCAVLDAIISAIYWQNASGPFPFHAWHGTVLLIGKLTLAAGLCALAAGVWNSSKSNSWLLVLNGLACSALGLAFAFWTGPLRFRTVALLIVLMALSIGLYEFSTARSLRRLADEWLLGLAGVASIGFASAFLGFVFRWIKLEPGSPAQSLHWLGTYFGFSAVCMLVLTLRLSSPLHRLTAAAPSTS